MNIKEKVLNELEHNKGEYISGSKLASNLDVSRNSVWKAIKSLEKDGYVIDAKTKTGYKLSEKSDILSPQSISKYLNHSLDIIVFDSISSTNTYLKELANNNAKEGTVVIATEQTAGKGRTGKSFFSPKDSGIYLSILLRPNIPADQCLFLTTSAAVATARAIEDVCDKQADIKWVNDIYIENKKVCGILTEASFDIESMGLDYVIVGIGINILKPKNGFPDDIKDIATAIFDSKSESNGKRSILIANLLDYFLDYYKDFSSKEYVKEYIERSMVLGKNISVIQGGQTKNAKAVEIDDNCRLKVEWEDGHTSWLSSGEVSIKV